MEDRIPAQSKPPVHNFVRFISGPSRGIGSATLRGAWELFIPQNILDEIVRCINLEAKRFYLLKKIKYQEVSIDEMVAFLGILLHMEADKSWDVPIREFLLGKFSNPFYRATISVNHFEAMRRFIMFFDKRTQKVRLQTAKLVLISYVWQIFTEQCRKVMVPKPNVTINELLVF
ncbi:hypothetical protein ANN_26493 [Periplaneta americana]|uniref:PiggyBac transposable element-derived protein domain-containing protein n=1 Tax=Periplaneta americana TaxID=6978 RepID=A0ABQ8RYI4_PERAM|nr:hypothetical protein ANN_26493 [Periplaneta americana]